MDSMEVDGSSYLEYLTRPTRYSPPSEKKRTFEHAFVRAPRDSVLSPLEPQAARLPSAPRLKSILKQRTESHTIVQTSGLRDYQNTLTPKSLTYHLQRKEELRQDFQRQEAARHEAREAPPRTIRGMFASVCNYFNAPQNILTTTWNFITGARRLEQQHQEIFAIETDHTGRKRRAVEGDVVPEIKHNTPSKMPGSFPVQLETPPESRPTSQQSSDSEDTSRHVRFSSSTNGSDSEEQSSEHSHYTANKTRDAHESTTTSGSHQSSAQSSSITDKPQAAHERRSNKWQCMPISMRPKGMKPEDVRPAQVYRKPEIVRRLPPPSLDDSEYNEDHEDSKVAGLIKKSKRFESAEVRNLRHALKESRLEERTKREKAAAIERARLVAIRDKAAREAEEEAEELARLEKEEEEAEAAAEAELKAATETAAKLTQPLFTALTPEIEEFVADAMHTKDRGKILVKDAEGVELSRASFGSLLPQPGTPDDQSGWLNDEIITGFIATIVKAKKEQVGYDISTKNQKAPPFACFNTAWYKTQKDHNTDKLKNWAKRKRIDGAKLFECEKLFLPFNTGAHWMLLIISGTERTIELLDSLNGRSGQTYINIARKFLASNLGDLYDADEWTVLDSKSSQQANSDDCGAFTCLNALGSAKGVPYTDIKMKDGRKYIAAVLLKGGFF